MENVRSSEVCLDSFRCGLFTEDQLSLEESTLLLKEEVSFGTSRLDDRASLALSPFSNSLDGVCVLSEGSHSGSLVPSVVMLRGG